MQIENIIFDLGNVLIDVDFEVFYQKLGYVPDAAELIKAKQVISKFEAGQIAVEDFIEELNSHWNLQLSVDEFKQIWTNLFTVNQQMIDLAAALNQKYSLFILSNTDEIHFPYIWNNFPELHFFQDRLLLSYQLGTVKPNPQIYQIACQKYHLNPKTSIFIDDKAENIISACELGFRGIIHKNYRETKQKLDEILKT
jgi:putative hydrolase of the HAD superfamily